MPNEKQKFVDELTALSEKYGVWLNSDADIHLTNPEFFLATAGYSLKKHRLGNTLFITTLVFECERKPDISRVFAE